MRAKNRLVHGALVAIWIAVPVFVMTMGCLMTDIVNGICVPWGVYGSYAAEKAMTSVMVLFSFLVPAILMIFFYARIVYKIKNKVTFCF